jgi:hypothetical protein
MSSSRESLNFSTASPLLAGGFFAPNRWDDLLDYSSILININCLGAGCRLTIYQSSNQVNISDEQEIIISAGELYSYSFPLYARFFKLRLDNPNLANQTALNCQVIFRQNYIPSSTAKGNALLWNAITGVNGVSSILDLSTANQQNITFYGIVNGATTLTVQFSYDGITFYKSQYTYTLSTAGDVGFNITAVAPYCRLISSNNVTAKIYASYN